MPEAVTEVPKEEAPEKFALRFESVCKQFEPSHSASQVGKMVVRDLSLSVRKGEFFSILGPSGCGKTTCLRMISGLERPTSGIIRMAGKVVNDVHPHKRNVHTVFQKYALFPHLNVFDNVAFGLRMKKLPKQQVREKVERVLGMVKLESYASRPIQKLSGGEQQRVALVRALVNEPAILLLDEPLAALDLKLREQMQHELSALQRQLGTTFIFVTHDQGEALTLSDRVAIMNAGCLEQVGTPTEVYEQPATAFAARFVGTTNVFTGTVSATAGYVKMSVEGLGDLYAKTDSSPSGRMGLVVRPEKIRIRVTAPSHAQQSGGRTAGAADAEGATAAATNVIRGTLTERVYFGPTTQIKLQPNNGHAPLIVLVANQTATKMPSLHVGSTYYAVWDATDSVLVPEKGI